MAYVVELRLLIVLSYILFKCTIGKEQDELFDSNLHRSSDPKRTDLEHHSKGHRLSSASLVSDVPDKIKWQKMKRKSFKVTPKINTIAFSYMFYKLNAFNKISSSVHAKLRATSFKPSSVVSPYSQNATDEPDLKEKEPALVEKHQELDAFTTKKIFSTQSPKVHQAQDPMGRTNTFPIVSRSLSTSDLKKSSWTSIINMHPTASKSLDVAPSATIRTLSASSTAKIYKAPLIVDGFPGESSPYRDSFDMKDLTSEKENSTSILEDKTQMKLALETPIGAYVTSVDVNSDSRRNDKQRLDPSESVSQLSISKSSHYEDFPTAVDNYEESGPYLGDRSSSELNRVFQSTKTLNEKLVKSITQVLSSHSDEDSKLWKMEIKSTPSVTGTEQLTVEGFATSAVNERDLQTESKPFRSLRLEQLLPTPNTKRSQQDSKQQVNRLETILLQRSITSARVLQASQQIAFNSHSLRRTNDVESTAPKILTNILPNHSSLIAFDSSTVSLAKATTSVSTKTYENMKEDTLPYEGDQGEEGPQESLLRGTETNAYVAATVKSSFDLPEASIMHESFESNENSIGYEKVEKSSDIWNQGSFHFITTLVSSSVAFKNDRPEKSLVQSIEPNIMLTEAKQFSESEMTPGMKAQRMRSMIEFERPSSGEVVSSVEDMNDFKTGNVGLISELVLERQTSTKPTKSFGYSQLKRTSVRYELDSSSTEILEEDPFRYFKPSIAKRTSRSLVKQPLYVIIPEKDSVPDKTHSLLGFSRELEKETQIAPSYLNTDVSKSAIDNPSTKPLNLIETIDNLSLSATKTPALSIPAQFVAESDSSQPPSTVSSTFMHSSFQTSAISTNPGSGGLTWQKMQELTASAKSTLDTVSYESLGDVAISLLHKIRESLLGILKPNLDENDKSEPTNNEENIKIKSSDSGEKINNENPASTEETKFKLKVTEGYDKSHILKQSKIIASSTSPISIHQSRDEKLESTVREKLTTRSLHRNQLKAQSSSCYHFSSTARWPQSGHGISAGKKSSIHIESIAIRPTTSEFLKSTPSNHRGHKESQCSYHFFKNVKEIEDEDDLQFEVLDIFSLKIKRIIAVRWPYSGYLGRVGFSHQGYVLQSMDGRFWYNHIKQKENVLYIVFLNSLLDLHPRVQIIYSNDPADEETIGEHVKAWGVSVGIYFKTCHGN